MLKIVDISMDASCWSTCCVLCLLGGTSDAGKNVPLSLLLCNFSAAPSARQRWLYDTSWRVFTTTDDDSNEHWSFFLRKMSVWLRIWGQTFGWNRIWIWYWSGSQVTIIGKMWGKVRLSGKLHTQLPSCTQTKCEKIWWMRDKFKGRRSPNHMDES